MFIGNLKKFQEKHEINLLDKLDDGYKDVVLQAPTGSGKTVMMCKFINDYLEKYNNTVFIWLCPGAGGLETQSQDSFIKFVKQVDYGDVYDFIQEDDPTGGVYFINWEKLNKKNNVVLRENEKSDLYVQFRKCFNKNIDIFFIVDEEHKNQDAANELIAVANPVHIVRISATPTTVCEYKEEIKDEEVIEEGLICSEISVNEGLSKEFEEGEIPEDNDVLLLEKADEKRKQISEEYKKRNIDIKPLVLIQFPNGKPEYIDKVKDKLNSMGYTKESGLVTEWFSGEHPDDAEEIKKLNGQYAFLLFKQAIATGWDCPRAKILVKLREGGTQEFNIQTIGRIRRMPERKHYDNELLDNCYLYTFDSKFKTGLTSSVNNSFYDYRYKRKPNKYLPNLGLKKQFLNGNDKVAVNQEKVVEIIRKRMLAESDVNKDNKLDKKELENKGYVFGTKLLSTSYEQVCKTTNDLIKVSNKFNISHEIDLHDDGFIIREAKRVIARSAKLEENISNNVLRVLFGPIEDDEQLSLFSSKEIEFEKKNKVIEGLSLREYDAFLVNNVDKLKVVFSEANANEYVVLEEAQIEEKTWNIPEYQYYKQHKLVPSHRVLEKNIFEEYGDNILMRPNRSNTEISFEIWCENNPNVEWIYKNGDKGDIYYSIVYKMSFSRANFYPDYIIKMNNGDIWIIEAKGGVDENGDSNNVDAYAKNKFDSLKTFCNNNGYKWGFVRSVGQFIYFSNTEWDENIYNNNVWIDINKVIK